MKADQTDVTEAAVLMCFLLFDEIAAVDVRYVQMSGDFPKE